MATETVLRVFKGNDGIYAETAFPRDVVEVEGQKMAEGSLYPNTRHYILNVDGELERYRKQYEGQNVDTSQWVGVGWGQTL